MELSSIRQFATQYLHEDWDIDHSDFLDVVADFIDNTEDHEQHELGKALQHITGEYPKEEDLEAALKKLDWQLYFDDVPISMILHQMSAALLDTP